MAKTVKDLPDIECMLTVKVGEYGAVCLPSQEGSTGYHWVLPSMPNCINRTADGWFAAITTGPGVGIPGFHYFVFIGVTPTTTSPTMIFYLMPPGGKAPARKAVCRVTVKK